MRSTPYNAADLCIPITEGHTCDEVAALRIRGAGITARFPINNGDLPERTLEAMAEAIEQHGAAGQIFRLESLNGAGEPIGSKSFKIPQPPAPITREPNMPDFDAPASPSRAPSTPEVAAMLAKIESDKTVSNLAEAIMKHGNDTTKTLSGLAEKMAMRVIDASESGRKGRPLEDKLTDLLSEKEATINTLRDALDKERDTVRSLTLIVGQQQDGEREKGEKGEKGEKKGATDVVTSIKELLTEIKGINPSSKQAEILEAMIAQVATGQSVALSQRAAKLCIQDRTGLIGGFIKIIMAGVPESEKDLQRASLMEGFIKLTGAAE